MSFQDGGEFGGDENSFGGGGGGRGGGKCCDDQTDISSEQFRKLFVGGLSYETDEKSLKSHFEQWGEIVDCVVKRDPDTKRSRGFGFITYKESFMIDEAQKNRPHRIDNREVETKRAMPRNADGSCNHQSVSKMFVGGLKDGTTGEQMRDVFGKFGEIDNVNIVTDKATGKCQGFAFITYKDYDSVDRAVLLKRHDLNTRRVAVEKAVPKYQMDDSSWRGGGGAGGFGSNYGGNYGGIPLKGSADMLLKAKEFMEMAMDKLAVVASAMVMVNSDDKVVTQAAGSGRGGGSVGWERGRGGGGSCGYSSNGAFRGDYGGASGCGYGGGYAGAQNWGGSNGYCDHNSSWGGGGGAGGFGSNYGGDYGGGPVKGSADMLLIARDLTEVAMDKLAMVAATMVVMDSDDKVVTEAAEHPEHINIQKVNQRKRKRKQEKAIAKSADNVVEGEAEDSHRCKKHHH